DEVELTKQLVVRRHFALALEHPDGHRVLIVLRGREHLALLGRNSGVAIDQARKDAAERFDAKRKRSDVQQQHVLDVALQHAGLDRSTNRDDLIGIDAFVRFLAEQLLYDLLDLRHARHAADQNHLVDLRRRQHRVLERNPAWLDRLLNEIVDQRLEFRAGQFHGQVLWPRRIRGDEWQVDFGLRGRRQLDLRLLGRLLQALQRELVATQVDALFLLELVGEIIDKTHVEIFAAEERVAVRRLHLEHTVSDLENRNVERPAAEIVDRDRAV